MGGECVVVDAPLDRLPLFVRAGAVIPMTAVETSTKLHDESSRLLRVYPRGDGGSAIASMLYEDDGSSRRYLEGAWALFELTLGVREKQLSIDIARSGHYGLPYRSGRIEVVGQAAADVLLTGDDSVAWDVVQ